MDSEMFGCRMHYENEGESRVTRIKNRIQIHQFRRLSCHATKEGSAYLQVNGVFLGMVKPTRNANANRHSVFPPVSVFFPFRYAAVRNLRVSYRYHR